MDWKTDYASSDDSVMDPCVHYDNYSKRRLLNLAAVALELVSMDQQLLTDLYPRPGKHLLIVCTSSEFGILMHLGEVLAWSFL